LWPPLQASRTEKFIGAAVHDRNEFMSIAREERNIRAPRHVEQLRHRILQEFATKWRAIPVLVSLAFIWGVFALQTPVFLSPRNLSNLADQIVTTSIVALGLTFVLLIAEIDLSVAALAAACSAAVGVLVVNQDFPLPIAMVIGIAIGGVVGLVQGSVIVCSGAPAFIVTLGSSLLLQGLLLQILPAGSGLVPLAGTGVQILAAYHLPSMVSYGLVGLAGLLTYWMRSPTIARDKRLVSTQIPSGRLA
jgi:D-xylose transport system permease protein